MIVFAAPQRVGSRKRLCLTLHSEELSILITATSPASTVKLRVSATFSTDSTTPIVRLCWRRPSEGKSRLLRRRGDLKCPRVTRCGCVEIHPHRLFIRHYAIKAAGEQVLLAAQALYQRCPGRPDVADGRTYKHFASVAEQQEALDEFVFGDLAIHEVTEFANRLTALKHRLEKARLKAALEF